MNDGEFKIWASKAAKRGFLESAQLLLGIAGLLGKRGRGVRKGPEISGRFGSEVTDFSENV